MDHFVQKNSQCPNVYLFSLLLSLVNFRGHVLISPTKSVLHLFVVHTCAEISKFWPIIFGDQNVFRLDVSVDHLFGMNVLDGLDDFVKELDDFPLIVLRDFLDKGEEISILREFYQHDDIVVSNFKIQELNNVLVVQVLVYLYLPKLPFLIL